jgi:hypothetical protein
MSKPLWTPGKERAAQTLLDAFSSWISSRTGKSLTGYDELHGFSVAEPLREGGTGDSGTCPGGGREPGIEPPW